MAARDRDDTGILLGGMQAWGLTIDRVLAHAEAVHPQRSVVTRTAEGELRSTDYAGVAAQARALARSLARVGVRRGDRVAMIAWTGDRHMALWYAVSAYGAVSHPINPRFSPDQIAWIVGHAGDRLMFLDSTFVPLVEALQDRLPGIERFVLLADEVDMPATGLRGAISYEAFLALGEGEADLAPGGFDENAACALFYTSGTTGDPKGVLYSHRSNVLHAMMLSPALNLTSHDVMMPVVPMFHANGWGLPYACPMVGAAMVMPGAALDPASLHALMEAQGVTITAGVPTLWQSLLQHMKDTGARFSTLRTILVAGSAAPRALLTEYRERFGVEVRHLWGMTETSPCGTANPLPPQGQDHDVEAAVRGELRQGRNPFGLEMRVANEAGAWLPHDGRSAGRLMVRGAAVVERYFRGERPAIDAEGWFDTGDVATIHPDHVMQITDRAKDLIKSGGEWISSIAIEDAAALHPATALCAVIAMPHAKWGERPLLAVKLKSGASGQAADYLTFLEGKIAKWWMPDEVVFIEDMPLGATGKVDKKALRARLVPQG
uniref:AMP-dependent synthetase and ligase n=1 Tax=Caulobacter sp. (strain K31) TaxID=366602 RepID=B0T9K6_CAUSK